MRTEILMILDRSGSMQVVRQDTVGAFNAFLAEQKKLPDPANVTLVLFNDSYTLLHEGQALQKVEALTERTYEPSGFTALLDAVGRTITDQGKRFDAMPADQKPEKVVCVILTDGQENHSRTWTRERVFDLISKQQKEWGWVFTYLGANVDSFAEASKLGISAAMSLDFGQDKKGMGAVMMAAARVVTSARQGQQILGYSMQARSAAAGSSGKMSCPEHTQGCPAGAHGTVLPLP